MLKEFFLIYLSVASVLCQASNGVIVNEDDQQKIIDVAFHKIGAYFGDENFSKTYYIPRFLQASWIHTRSICNSFGMDVLSLDSEDESDHFLRLCQKKSSYFEKSTYIGGMTNSGFGADGWFWWNSGEKINFTLDWEANEPNFGGEYEYCLSIVQDDVTKATKFNDMPCYGPYERKFICQKTQLRETTG